LLHQGHEFGWKGGEGGQATAKSDHDEKAQLRQDGRVGRKGRNGKSDDVAADKVGGERTGWDRREETVELRAEPPAQKRPKLAPPTRHATDAQAFWSVQILVLWAVTEHRRVEVVYGIGGDRHSE
jgi:hypothetical protein